MSNGALCATSTVPRANSRNEPSTESIGGALETIASVMPVSTLMNAVIGCRGSTRVWNSPRTSPPRTFTAPISVIASVAAEPPVVSRSTTVKVVVRSGWSSSSNAVWINVGCVTADWRPQVGVGATKTEWTTPRVGRNVVEGPPLAFVRSGWRKRPEKMNRDVDRL